MRLEREVGAAGDGHAVLDTGVAGDLDIVCACRRGDEVLDRLADVGRPAHAACQDVAIAVDDGDLGCLAVEALGHDRGSLALGEGERIVILRVLRGGFGLSTPQMVRPTGAGTNVSTSWSPYWSNSAGPSSYVRRPDVARIRTREGRVLGLIGAVVAGF